MKETLRAIQYNQGYFPREELERLIANQEETIPLLLEVIEQVKQDPMQMINDYNRMDFMYALFLLQQFRVKAFFPSLIQLASLPAEVCDQLFGDLITEVLGKALAATYDGDLASLQGLVENADANEYARGQALVALVILHLQEGLPREVILTYFNELLTVKYVPDHVNDYFNQELVICCLDLRLDELFPTIKQLYQQRLIEEELIRRSDFEQDASLPQEQILAKTRQDYRYQLIEDTIAELQDWNCFKPQVSYSNSASRSSNTDILNAITDYSKIAGLQQPIVAAVTPGRNDPCSCGSGLKYKKCCGK